MLVIPSVISRITHNTPRATASGVLIAQAWQQERRPARRHARTPTGVRALRIDSRPWRHQPVFTRARRSGYCSRAEISVRRSSSVRARTPPGSADPRLRTSCSPTTGPARRSSSTRSSRETSSSQAFPQVADLVSRRPSAIRVTRVWCAGGRDMQRDDAPDFNTSRRTARVPSFVEARLEELERDRNAERGPSKRRVRRGRSSSVESYLWIRRRSPHSHARQAGRSTLRQGRVARTESPAPDRS